MEKRLFEVPIYSMKENIFNKKWEHFFAEKVNKTSGDNKISFNNWLRDNYYSQRQWKFNKIIGSLVILYRDNSLWFDEYLTLDNNIHAVAKSKHFSINQNLICYHFYVDFKKNDEDIKQELLHWITSFQKEVMDNKYFLDKDLVLY